MTEFAPQIGDAPPSEAPPPEPLVFEFRGNAREYFRIWVVNLALSLSTLGLYSPWAKVRRLRYFYGNTYLDGSSFEFLGSPIAILKGRVIAVTAFGAYWYASHFHPVANVVLVPILAIGFPWVMVKALRFRARHSAFRNITFSYYGRYVSLAIAYLTVPILATGAIITVFVLIGGTVDFSGAVPVVLDPAAAKRFALTFPAVMLVALAVYPYFYFRQRRAIFAPRGFGDTAFEFHCGPGAFYGVFLLTILLAVCAFVAFGLSAWFTGVVGKAAHISMSSELIQKVLPLLFGLVYLYIFVAFNTLVRNRVINALRIGEARLVSRLSVGTVYWLYLSNIAAIVCSLGLLAPWAKIRLTRYQLAQTSLITPQGTEEFPGSPGESASAVGEELAEVFDLDLAI